MNRRESIKRLALSFGYVVSAPAVVGVLESCTGKQKSWSPKYFSQEEQHFVTHLVDIILPASDTPGGFDENLPQFIDMMCQDMFEAEEQSIFKKGSALFSMKFGQQYGKDIGVSTRAEIAELFGSFFDIDAKEQGTIQYMQSKKIEEVREEEKESYMIYKFLFNIRSLSLFGYFTSEKVGREVLNFDPIPGQYVPCVPVSEIGNAWTI